MAGERNALDNTAVQVSKGWPVLLFLFFFFKLILNRLSDKKQQMWTTGLFLAYLALPVLNSFLYFSDQNSKVSLGSQHT